MDSRTLTAAGFTGVSFLAWPGSGAGIALGPAMLVAGAACWGASMVVIGWSGTGRRPVLIAGIQTLVGGALAPPGRGHPRAQT